MDTFDSADFEKRLASLKDTQDSIQSLSAWCLKNRASHKKVVSSWLSVLKQVKVEHRLILFYLANDVIQHSKRKNFEFVDSWGTTLQRATTMVRSDETVKAKIIRIFTIWEQRDIYSDEFLADLRDLLNINPTKNPAAAGAVQSSASASASAAAAVAADPDASDEHVHILSSSIRSCVRLEHATDRALKLASAQPPLPDAEAIQQLKDRRQVEACAEQMAEYRAQLERCVRALNDEFKGRTKLLAVMDQTVAFYHNQRGEAKVVANAYRNFNSRMNNMKRKVDELCVTLPSPLPSPDVNAPSPGPEDNEYDLHLDGRGGGGGFDPAANNGFLSFGQGKPLPFDIADFTRSRGGAQPIQVIGGSKGGASPVSPAKSAGSTAAAAASSAATASDTDFNIDDFFKTLMHEQHAKSGGGKAAAQPPQPVPPVGQQQQQQQTYTSMSSYTTMPSTTGYGHQAQSQAYHNHQQQPQPPPQQQSYAADEYNPESWDHRQQAPSQQQQQQQQLDMSWSSSQSDASFGNHPEATRGSSPQVAHEFGALGRPGAADVDHRLLQLPPGILSALSGKEKSRVLDVDHRNLISLTGSPTPIAGPLTGGASAAKAGDDDGGGGDDGGAGEPIAALAWSSRSDTQRIPGIGTDTDYRNAAAALAESRLFQPPLPPAPPKIPLLESPPVGSKPPLPLMSPFVDILGNSPSMLPQPHSKQSPHRSLGGGKRNGGQRDNVEAIDMEMSDEDYEDNNYLQQQHQQQQQQDAFDADGSFNSDMQHPVAPPPPAPQPPPSFAGNSGSGGGHLYQGPPPSVTYSQPGQKPFAPLIQPPPLGGGGAWHNSNNSSSSSANRPPNMWMADAGRQQHDTDNPDQYDGHSGDVDHESPDDVNAATPKRVNPFGQRTSVVANTAAPPMDGEEHWSTPPKTFQQQQPTYGNQPMFDGPAPDMGDMSQPGCSDSEDDGFGDGGGGGFGDGGYGGNNNNNMMMHPGPMAGQRNHMMGGGGGGGPPRHFMGHGPGGGGGGGGNGPPGPWNNHGGRPPGPPGPGAWNNGPPMQPMPPMGGFGSPQMGGGRGGGGFRGNGRGGSPYFRPPGGGMRGGPPRPHFRPNFRGNMRGGGGGGNW